MNARGWSAWTTRGQNNSDKLATSLYRVAEKYFLEDGQKLRKDMSDGDPDWESNFTVIKGANCPAILTESFFYDNMDDLMYLMSDKGIENIVKVHVEGIQNYINTYKK
jgi:N-acetylmuramoyl-L-alanine amidase